MVQQDGVLGCVEVGRVPKKPWFPFPTADEESTRLYETRSLCSAQDARIQWMLDRDLIKIQWQNSYTRAIAALGRSLRTDPQLPCRQIAPLLGLPDGAGGNCSSSAATCGSGRGAPAADNAHDRWGSTEAQITVFVRDEAGRGMAGKSLHLWVKPDLPGTIDDRVLFQPGNPRVGLRSVPLTELGGGAYLFDDRAGVGGEGGVGGSPFLWVQASQTLPDGSDGRYGKWGDSCFNCSNAPFEYTFVVGKSRVLQSVGGWWRLVSLLGFRRQPPCAAIG